MAAAKKHTEQALSARLPTDAAHPRRCLRLHGVGVCAHLERAVQEASPSLGIDARHRQAIAGWFATDHISEAAGRLSARACGVVRRAIGAPPRMARPSLRVVACAVLRLQLGISVEAWCGAHCASKPMANAVAMWNDAHLAFLRCVLTLSASGMHLLVNTWAPLVRASSLTSSSFSLPTLAQFLTHRVSRPKYVRAVHPLIQLMVRATHGNNRSWQRAVLSIINEQPAIRQLLLHHLSVYLRGDHPLCPIDARPSLAERAAISYSLASIAKLRNSPTLSSAMVDCSQTLRRTVHVLLLEWDALHTCEGIPVQLGQADEKTFAEAAQRIEATFCAASRRFCLAAKKLVARFATTSPLYALAEAHKDLQAVLSCVTIPVLPPYHVKTSNISVCNDTYLASHLVHFAPLWNHRAGLGHKLTRLPATLHRAMMACNTAISIADSLSKESARRVHEMVLQDPSAALRTASELLSRLRSASCSEDRRKKAPTVCSATDLIGQSDPRSKEELASLLHHARLAGVRELVFVVHLPSDMAKRQSAALHRRFLSLLGRTDVDPTLGMLHMCTCCGRTCSVIANCKGHSAENVDGSVGHRSAMMGVDDSMYCARRSSLVLRNAHARAIRDVALCEHGDDLFSLDSTCVQSMLHMTRPARVLCKRDGQLSLRQRSSLSNCDEHPLVSMPLEGRLVRFGPTWYTLCMRCGAHMTLRPGENVVGAGFCCFACNGDVVGSHTAHKSRSRRVDSTPSVPKAPSDGSSMLDSCAVCGKTQRACAKLLCIRSPLDDSLCSQLLPAPLRCTFWCRQHTRHWLPCALSRLSTSIVRLHVLNNTVPTLVEEQEEQEEQEEEEEEVVESVSHLAASATRKRALAAEGAPGKSKKVCRG